jgi:hypothetical protein
MYPMIVSTKSGYLRLMRVVLLNNFLIVTYLIIVDS